MVDVTQNSLTLYHFFKLVSFRINLFYGHLKTFFALFYITIDNIKMFFAL